MDESKRGAIKTVGATPGVPDVAVMIEFVEKAVLTFLNPKTLSRKPLSIEHAGNHFVVVNVPPSRYLVGVWEGQGKGIEYLYRTAHGKEHMSPDDVEKHIMNSSRAAQIAFKEACAQGSHDQIAIIGGVEKLDHARTPGRLHSHSITLATVQDTYFALHISTGVNGELRRITIPYGLLREAWVHEQRIHIMLNARVVWLDEPGPEGGLVIDS